jgi:hypothetical protein
LNGDLLIGRPLQEALHNGPIGLALVKPDPAKSRFQNLGKIWGKNLGTKIWKNLGTDGKIWGQTGRTPLYKTYE